MKITGRCYCGDITYHAEVDENKVINCHCTDCQKMSSGPLRTVVLSYPGAVTFNATLPKEYIKTAQSGNKRAQGFCGNCGTSLYATSVGGSDAERIYGLRIGAVHEREQLTPKAQIWCRSSASWLNELNTMNNFETTPPAN
ncbi:GFA family protein [Pseudoalteromonas sp. MMG010]|uniref:GFA family protein n=1 Tax=Pseudoalteromonas sp. MMG010 TaxID=2822685 RepID=UPI001B39F3B9|nr:GFA family protein [Pseudoalteromonas sp. MMG010]MBQ4832112.1 GFA family protein [Pseudoalteromonas sp. MMG010]